MIKPLIFSFLIFFFTTEGEFKDNQLRYSRVRNAFSEKGELAASLKSSGELNIFLRGLKQEKELELWASNGRGPYRLVKTYPFCSFSGELGPKRKQGDGQVPEGLYHIDRYNPSSNFYLSLGINYPNKSDQIRKTGPAGGDIFIHGSCVTIGCIPIEDSGIMELYAVAVEAKDAGQTKIPVHIFPFRMNKEKAQISGSNKEFWEELLPLYNEFEQKKEIPVFSISGSGQYQLK